MAKQKKLYLVIGTLLTIALVGCFMFYAHWRSTYSSIDTSDPIGQLELHEKKDTEITIIFHRKGCEACEKAEHVIVPNVRKARKSGQEVIVIDVSKLSKHDMTIIEKLVPSAFFNNHIPTPQVVKIQPDGIGGWEVVDQSSQTTLDLKTIKQMLKESDS